MGKLHEGFSEMHGLGSSAVRTLPSPSSTLNPSKLNLVLNSQSFRIEANSHLMDRSKFIDE